jgi:hypothetical protein
MRPNEWGDFFAGFFAPLAFLWLVLGYLQQGQELQLSTQALRLQADELKNSVEQQRELVEVTRQQVESEREALHLERISRREAAKPRFIARSGGGSFSTLGFNYGVSISNAGNLASQVVITMDGPEIESKKIFESPLFERSSIKNFQIFMQRRLPSSGATITVSYLDADGQPDSTRFKAMTVDDSTNALLEFSPIVG